MGKNIYNKQKVTTYAKFGAQKSQFVVTFIYNFTYFRSYIFFMQLLTKNIRASLVFVNTELDQTQRGEQHLECQLLPKHLYTQLFI
jgi:hypothetical protein